MEKVLLFLLFAALIAVIVYFMHLANRIKSNKNSKAVHQTTDDEAFHLKNNLPPAECYSKELADACITDDYRFNNRHDIFLQATEDKGELGELWTHLMQMNLGSPENRVPDENDKWFIQNVSKFIKYGETLAFVEHYPRLENMLLDNLQDPEHNLELQKRLISICIVGSWRINYINLLCLYLCKWDLLPEIEAVVFYDWRFERVRNVYNIYHKRQ